MRGILTLLVYYPAMTDQPLPKPPRVPVTPEFRAQQADAERRYIESRRAWMAHFEPQDIEHDDTAQQPNKPLSLNLATRARRREKDHHQLQLPLQRP